MDFAIIALRKHTLLARAYCMADIRVGWQMVTPGQESRVRSIKRGAHMVVYTTYLHLQRQMKVATMMMMAAAVAPRAAPSTSSSISHRAP